MKTVPPPRPARSPVPARTAAPAPTVRPVSPRADEDPGSVAPGPSGVWSGLAQALSVMGRRVLGRWLARGPAPSVAQPALSPTARCKASHRTFETWYDAHHAKAPWSEVVRQAPLPDWARALLLNTPCATDPSLHDLRDGGLMLCLAPDTPRPLGPRGPLPPGEHEILWWTAGMAHTVLNPDAWRAWSMDGEHRFTAPLAWFLRTSDKVPATLTVAAAVAPQEAWSRRWREDGFGPFQTLRPSPLPPEPRQVGWRLGPLELAALVDRWDLVERWGACDPSLVPAAQALLVDRGIRPWMGEHGWSYTHRDGTEDGKRTGSERVARAWEAVVLRLSVDDALRTGGEPAVPPSARPRARL